MTTANVTLPAWQCTRCAHRWAIRDETKPPAVCAKCHSRYWQKPRRLLTVEQAVRLAAEGKL